jgi:hypothetical protein
VQPPLSQTSKNVIFFFFFFPLKKLENRKVEQVLPGGRGAELVPMGEGSVRERGRRVNMVQILCTHVCECKNNTY